MTPSNLIVETNSTEQGNIEQSEGKMRLSVLQFQLLFRQESLDPVREEIEDLLATDGIEIECYSPDIRSELDKASPALRDESQVIDVDAEVVDCFNSISVEIYPSAVRFNFLGGVKQGLSDALRERARLLLSLAERVLADPDFEEIPEVTKDDLLSPGGVLMEAIRKEEEGDPLKRYEVVDCCRVVFSSPRLASAKSFCAGAKLPESAIREIDIEAPAKSA